MPLNERDGLALTVSDNECMAIRFLHAAGYSTADIAAFLEYQTDTVAKHADNRCHHERLTQPQELHTLSPDRIRTLRLQEDLTQAELAAAVDVGPATVSCWENGHNNPGRQTLRKLYEVLPVGWGDTDV